jgi:FKBP-type peptidyl-prolyl cis-trans isomerase (trigger factor)
MTAGIKIITETEGTGHRAEKGDAVVLDCAAYLNKGDVIHSRRAETIVLGSRRLIPGVEYAVIGMAHSVPSCSGPASFLSIGKSSVASIK